MQHTADVLHYKNLTSPSHYSVFEGKKKKSSSDEEIVKSRLVPLTRHGYDYKGITTALGKTSGQTAVAAATGHRARHGLLSLPPPRADNAAVVNATESNICRQIGGAEGNGKAVHKQLLLIICNMRGRRICGA